MAVVSSKMGMGGKPIKIYRRKHYEKKRTFRSEYVEDILKTHFNRHGSRQASLNTRSPRIFPATFVRSNDTKPANNSQTGMS